MKILLSILLLIFFSQSLIAKEIDVRTESGGDIYEVELIIEDPQNCINEKEIETEIKYIFSNSNIKISKNSPYYLYVKSSFLHVQDRDFCFGKIGMQIYSQIWDDLNIIGSNVAWQKGSIFLKSSPYKNYLLGEYGAMAKKAIVWINDNNK